MILDRRFKPTLFIEPSAARVQVHAQYGAARASATTAACAAASSSYARRPSRLPASVTTVKVEAQRTAGFARTVCRVARSRTAARAHTHRALVRVAREQQLAAHASLEARAHPLDDPASAMACAFQLWTELRVTSPFGGDHPKSQFRKSQFRAVRAHAVQARTETRAQHTTQPCATAPLTVQGSGRFLHAAGPTRAA